MIYCKTNNYELRQGKMQDELYTLKPNSIECIITDPPYELNFMGKGWDNVGVSFQKETWEHCFRVLKPGGHLLAFGGSRTFHRIACAIEDAGFDIRDTIMWIYGSGFPKSMDIGKAIEGKLTIGSAKEWSGWGTALKPAYEPIIISRKPFNGSLVDNVLEYGVGGLNIDECRVGNEYISGGTTPDLRDVGKKQKEISGIDKLSFGQVENADRIPYEGHIGRFPSNLILSYSEEDYNEVCGGFPYTKSTGGKGESSKVSTLSNYDGGWKKEKDCAHLGGLGDSGSASRYFYCAKASKRDRNEGLYESEKAPQKNNHPTVKPTSLMSYLVRLVAPKGATILDPFMGSGSTGKAVMYENNDRNSDYKFIGVEMTEEYLPIAKARIDFAIEDKEQIEEIPPIKTEKESREKSKEEFQKFNFIS